MSCASIRPNVHVNGYVTTFTAMPEPPSLAPAAAGAIAALGWRALLRRKRDRRPTGWGFAEFVLAAVFLSAAHAHAVTMDWVVVGNPGNANSVYGYGAVALDYQIGKYEVTIGQYAEFLNAVAKSDPYGLYNSNMGTNLNVSGISQSGSSGNYAYSVMTNGGNSANRPITYVSWFDAARFANWMHNGQGNGDTETGAYTLVNGQTSGTAPARNPGAQFFIPTENQWYKAAYYQGPPGNYAFFATMASTAPGNTIGSGSNQANYYANDYAVTQSASYSSSQNYLTDVGAFTSNPSFYGTFDQSGNVYEWNDLDGLPGTTRGKRGGSWGETSTNLSMAGRPSPQTTALQENDLGFRLAAPIPEPSTAIMALAGLACGGVLVRRRRGAHPRP